MLWDNQMVGSVHSFHSSAEAVRKMCAIGKSLLREGNVSTHTTRNTHNNDKLHSRLLYFLFLYIILLLFFHVNVNLKLK